MALSYLDTVANRASESPRSPISRFAAFGVASVAPIAVLAGLLIRALLVNAQSAWLDEGYSIGLSRHSLSYILDFTRKYDLHPPLFYMVLHLWTAVLGGGPVQARLLSVTCGVAAIAVMYGLGSALFESRTGAVAALLLAVSPVAVWYSDEARMYSMALLFEVLALWFLVRALQGERWRAWVPYVVSAAVAFYVDYSVSYALVCAVALAVFLVRSRRDRLQECLAAQVVLLLLILPGLLMLWGQSRNLSGVAWIPAPSLSGVGAALLDLAGLHEPVPVLGLVVAVALSVTGVVAAMDEWPEPQKRLGFSVALVTFLGAVVVPLVLSAVHPVFLTRTILPALPGLLVLWARGLVYLWNRHLLPLAIAVAALVLLNGSALVASAVSPWNADWRGAGSYLNQTALSGDLLLFDPGYGQLPFDLYWNGSAGALPQHGYPADETLLHTHIQLFNSRIPRSTLRHHRIVWLLGGGGNLLPRDAATAWLQAHARAVGGATLYGLSVWRYVPRSWGTTSTSAPWLDSVAVVNCLARHSDVVLARGKGSKAFVRMWKSYPNSGAKLIVLKKHVAGLSLLIPRSTRSIWLVTLPAGNVDPAGFESGWLYHHGPQVRPMRLFGQLRLYNFAYSWGRG